MRVSTPAGDLQSIVCGHGNVCVFLGTLGPGRFPSGSSSHSDGISIPHLRVTYGVGNVWFHLNPFMTVLTCFLTGGKMWSGKDVDVDGVGKAWSRCGRRRFGRRRSFCCRMWILRAMMAILFPAGSPVHPPFLRRPRRLDRFPRNVYVRVVESKTRWNE